MRKYEVITECRCLAFFPFKILPLPASGTQVFTAPWWTKYTMAALFLNDFKKKIMGISVQFCNTDHIK